MAASTSTEALPESNVPLSPLLSLSEEEFLMRDVSVSASTTHVSKTDFSILMYTLFRQRFYCILKFLNDLG